MVFHNVCSLSGLLITHLPKQHKVDVTATDITVFWNLAISDEFTNAPVTVSGELRTGSRRSTIISSFDI